MTTTAVAPNNTAVPPTTTVGQGSTPTSGATGTSSVSINNGIASLADNFQSFLGLLTTQLQNQDPLNPTDTNQFTQQITQMTGVEQQLLSNNLLQQLVTQQTGVLGAAGLIGKVVSAPGATSSAAPISGVVTAVQNVGGQTMLTVGSNQVPLDSVTSVAADSSNPLAALLGG